jgi:hypothetical protein
MGTWGAGNFESDESLSYLDELIAQLVERIETCLSSLEHPSERDEFSGSLDCGEERLMPSVDIICLLCEHYEEPPNIEIDQVIRWRDQYLAACDEHIDDYGPKPEYKRERRQVIIETFEKLQGIVTFWSDAESSASG